MLSIVKITLFAAFLVQVDLYYDYHTDQYYDINFMSTTAKYDNS